MRAVLRFLDVSNRPASACCSVLVAILLLAAIAPPARAEEPIRIELNASENLQGRCRLLQNP